MTSFYNRFQLENKDIKKSILKDNFTLNYSDWQKLKINEQYNKLYSNVYGVNNKEKLTSNETIFNYKLNEFIKKSSRVYINIINDITDFASSRDQSLNKFAMIFVKDENLIYVGALVLLLAFLLWLIDATS